MYKAIIDIEIDEEEENDAFETYLTERRVTPKKPFLATELWQRLSHEDKQVWGKLSSGGKLIILHGNKERDLNKSPVNKIEIKLQNITCSFLSKNEC